MGRLLQRKLALDLAVVVLIAIVGSIMNGLSFD